MILPLFPFFKLPFAPDSCWTNFGALHLWLTLSRAILVEIGIFQLFSDSNKISIVFADCACAMYLTNAVFCWLYLTNAHLSMLLTSTTCSLLCLSWLQRIFSALLYYTWCTCTCICLTCSLLCVHVLQKKYVSYFPLFCSSDFSFQMFSSPIFDIWNT